MIGKRGWILAVAGVVLSVLVGMAPAYAWWKDSAAGTASVTAATLAPPTKLTCSGAGLGSMPTIGWTAPTAAPAPNGYTVSYAGSGIVGAQSGSVTVTGTSWQLPSSLAAVGVTYKITVQSNLYNWRSPSLGTATVTVALGALGVNVTSCSVA